MAESQYTRRSFIAGSVVAGGAAIAAGALPVIASAVPTRAAPIAFTGDRHRIPQPPTEAMDALRGYYLAAVARVATELRPRFLSGELHGWREADSERMEAGTDGPPWIPALWRVQDECGVRFVRGSVERAYVVLAVSPSETETFDSSFDPRYAAAATMGYDVIRHARAQGWAPMEPGEGAPGAEPGTRRRSEFRGWRLQKCRGIAGP